MSLRDSGRKRLAAGISARRAGLTRLMIEMTFSWAVAGHGPPGAAVALFQAPPLRLVGDAGGPPGQAVVRVVGDLHQRRHRIARHPYKHLLIRLAVRAGHELDHLHDARGHPNLAQSRGGPAGVLDDVVQPSGHHHHRAERFESLGDRPQVLTVGHADLVDLPPVRPIASIATCSTVMNTPHLHLAL